MKKGQYYIGLKINYVFSGNAEGNAILGNAVKYFTMSTTKVYRDVRR